MLLLVEALSSQQSAKETAASCWLLAASRTELLARKMKASSDLTHHSAKMFRG
jgi:hypothetical protein